MTARNNMSPRLRLFLKKAAQPSLAEIQKDREAAPEGLKEVLDYLEKHLFDPEINVKVLQDRLKIRNNNYWLEFSASTGMPPWRYVSTKRCETAAKLLRETRLRIWEIAEMVGYWKIATFSKAFLRYSSHRPSEYRRLALAAERYDLGSPELLYPSQEFLQKAMDGRLDREKGLELIAYLRKLYPLPAPLDRTILF